MKWLLVFFAALLSFFVSAQGRLIEGTLLDRQTKRSIPFAKIYNKTNKEGTITNDVGYFKLSVSGANDEIFVTQIGYKNQNLLYDLAIHFQTVYLDANLQLIDEMIAKPRDISYLCNLIETCRMHENKKKINGKAYYELKSFIDTNQIELVEGFYNYTSAGYDMGNIALKAGRLAIRPDEEKMFMSLESSKAITQLKLFKTNEYFPEGPFDMKAKLMEKKFYMSLQYKYILENRDSVYVIDYRPKDTSGNYFEGTIWINKSNSQVLKVTTNCTDCAKYPFLPIFPMDEILQLDMNITKTFTENNGAMCFNHVDFQYDIAYKSLIRDSSFLYTRQAIDPQNDSLFRLLHIKTKAVLYSFDQKNQFQLPKFSFTADVSDYRKINGLPHNAFFWKNNTEDRVNSQKGSNELFFTDTSSIKDKELFNLYFYGSKKIGFVLWYKEWSKSRIRFRNIVETEREQVGDVFSTKPLKPALQSDKYEIEIQLFADINRYADSIHILTAAIFDPFKSYYNLPMNMATHCFINMYFDLHEVARRELQIALENDPHNFDEVYTKFMNIFKTTKRKFFSDVERGTNEYEMYKWNEFIVQKLGVDNVALFNPFPKDVYSAGEE